MKSKRILCVLLALCLSAALLTGCYNPKNVMTIGDMEIPSGVFLLYQQRAVATATTTYGESLLEGLTIYDVTIEGKPAREWIDEETDKALRRYAFTEMEFDRLGLEFNESEMSINNYYLNYAWQSDGESSVANGISYESYKKAYMSSFKESKILSTLYGEGGEKALPTAALEQYFIDTYTRADIVKFPTTGADGAALSAEQLEAVRGLAEDMLRDLRAGGDMDAAYATYFENAYRVTGRFDDPDGSGDAVAEQPEEPAEETAGAEEETVQTPEEILAADKAANISLDTMSIKTSTTHSTAFNDALFAAQEDVYELYAGDTEILLYRRLAFHEDDSYESYKSNIIFAIAGDDFDEYMDAGGAALDMKVDTRARKYYSVDKIK